MESTLYELSIVMKKGPQKHILSAIPVFLPAKYPADSRAVYLAGAEIFLPFGMYEMRMNIFLHGMKETSHNCRRSGLRPFSKSLDRHPPASSCLSGHHPSRPGGTDISGFIASYLQEIIIILSAPFSVIAFSDII